MWKNFYDITLKKMSNKREVLTISLASGALSICGYILLKKLWHRGEKKEKEPQQQEASRIYEEKALLDQYMLFNFAEPEDFLLFDLEKYTDVKHSILFPKRIALLCKDYCPDIFFSEEVCGFSLSLYGFLFEKIIVISFSEKGKSSTSCARRWLCRWTLVF